jgi:streptogramin lyase
MRLSKRALGFKYTTRQSQEEALRDDVFRDDVWIGDVTGPFLRTKSHRKNFFEWRLPSARSENAYIPGASGESYARVNAFNAIIRADVKRLERFLEE